MFVYAVKLSRRVEFRRNTHFFFLHRKGSLTCRDNIRMDHTLPQLHFTSDRCSVSDAFWVRNQLFDCSKCRTCSHEACFCPTTVEKEPRCRWKEWKLIPKCSPDGGLSAKPNQGLEMFADFGCKPLHVNVAALPPLAS